jgi:predicted anti-sigma-YlaC factor YlaD
MKFNSKAMLILGCVVVLNGCAIREVAVNKLADALAEGGTVYASDNDIVLVGEALPFSLKTIEGLLQQVPHHEGLLLTAASGFTQYSYVWVDLPSREQALINPERARESKQRAKNLYLRARQYAVRAVEIRRPGFMSLYVQDPHSALKEIERSDIPALYWLSLSWAAAIAADKSDMEMVADLNLIYPIMQRCLDLDESYQEGALHEFMIVYQGSRSPLQGGGTDLARAHFERVMELAGNNRVGPLVSFAETVSIAEQDKAEFTALLEQALEFDVDLAIPTRLANLVAQKRARLLLAQTDNLFLED